MNPLTLENLTPGSTSTLLISLLKNGSADAWETFHRLYRPLVIHWCRKCRVGAADAEDVYQESCLRVKCSINRFELEKKTSTFRGWLWVIVKRSISDWRTSSGIRKPGYTDDDSQVLESLPDESPEELTEYQKWIVRGIEEVRRHVSVRVFQYAELKYRDGWSNAEIADYLGVTVSAVITGRNRFLAKLRGILGETPPPKSPPAPE